MHKLHVHKVGLAVGTFAALVHAVWALLVAMGYGLGKLNFVLGMHFISVPVTMTAFSWGGGLMLVVLAGIMGYVAGAVFAWIWNKVGA
jgi:hypothetical protein